jgi:hypothetical protein
MRFITFRFLFIQLRKIQKTKENEMKNQFLMILTLTALGLSSAFSKAGERESGGGSPFIVEGQKIQAIFASSKVWQKLGGTVESISVDSRQGARTVYNVTTLEPVAIKDANGVTTDWKITGCTSLVTVDNVGGEMTPEWDVTTVDFSRCPAISN